MNDDELHITGFNMFRADRIVGEKTRGGGLLLYIRDKFTALKLKKDDDISETLWVRLVVSGSGDKDLVIGVCYKSLTASNKKIIKMHALFRKYSNMAAVILGNFNHRNIDWITGEAGVKGKEFLYLVYDCFLIQWVEGNTRGVIC